MTPSEQHFRATAPIYMRKLLVDIPQWDKLDAAAVFGNFGHESRGLTDDQEDNPSVKGSRGGLNWAQWTGPRRRAMEAYCAAHQLDPNSDEAAYAFLIVELTGSYHRTVQATHLKKTLNTKVEAFEKSYEGAGIKHYPERKRWAKLALEAFEANEGAASPSPAGVHAAPEAPATPSPDVVLSVQQQLRDLGYSEAGKPDGLMGPLTETAILAFRKDNPPLPLTPAIDDALIVALASAKPRQLGPEREQATPKDVRTEVPEVKANWLTKISAWWGAISAAVLAFGNWLVSSFGEVREKVRPVLDVLGDVPGWVYLLVVAGGAIAIYRIAHQGEKSGVAAYQAGERR